MWFYASFIYYFYFFLLFERRFLFRYLTYTEWTTLYGGKKSGVQTTDDVTFKRLPFDHCCLSLIHFEHPYCDPDGNVFELQMVVDFIEHFKVNPVTGKVIILIGLLIFQ